MKNFELTVSTNVYPLSGIHNFTWLQHNILYKIFATRNKMQVPFLEFGGMIQSIMSSGNTGGQWWHAGCW